MIPTKSLMAGLLLLAVPALADPALPMVASTMVCADQYPLALLPPENIIGVSALGHDPIISALADRAARLPTIKNDAESYIMAQADLVLGSDMGDSKTLSTLQRLGVEVLRIPSRNSFPAIWEQLAIVSRKLKAEGTAKALDDDARRRLEAVPSTPADRSVVAAYFNSGYGTAAAGTYVDEEMKAAGYRSLATELGMKGWARLDLETLVLHRPPAIVQANFAMKTNRLSARFMQNPVFQKIRDSVTVVNIPGYKTACGNWTLVEGVEFLHAARQGGDTP
ncbi:ABC transporter substrate-binding protein [Magnetospirillum sulfuroxidans]|uniref:ABC transporter substrate-binding protein n=1 Tax=Magnetospirillum sulfuroxidans TaxID=611300 RepID=A0ABS5IHM5_9PROT|nr:ABC transporter substrate-binding protein [Magnetospirillum sulfuroxidans]MBR9973771.1 ABC transporter substrate-binding protein [Magnetospirillum sulfuroxidans]